MGNKIRTFFKDYKNSLKEVPVFLLVSFLITMILMNILANKTIFQNDLIAIDGGIFVTWIVVIVMDLVTILCGPKVSIRLSIFGTLISLFVSLIFFLVSLIPASKDFDAFNKVLGGTWFIIVSGAIAFLCSSSLNSLINFGVGKLFKEPVSKVAFAIRCHVSTLISQIFDNFVFNALAFMVFAPIFWNGFCWTPVQCIMCALVYGAMELVIEILIVPALYKLYKYYVNKKEAVQS